MCVVSTGASYKRGKEQRSAPHRHAGLQGLLGKERQEHAQLVTSLQAMITGLQSAGGTEANLRSQLIQLAEQVAMLTAAQVGGKGQAYWERGQGHMMDAHLKGSNRLAA